MVSEERGSVLLPFRKESHFPLGAGCGVVQVMLPFHVSPLYPATPNPQPSHSCTRGQVSYEHQQIYKHSFMAEGKLGRGTSGQRFCIAALRIMHSPQRISKMGESKGPSQGLSAYWSPTTSMALLPNQGLPRKQSQSFVLGPVTTTKGSKIGVQG